MFSVLFGSGRSGRVGVLATAAFVFTGVCQTYAFPDFHVLIALLGDVLFRKVEEEETGAYDGSPGW